MIFLADVISRIPDRGIKCVKCGKPFKKEDLCIHAGAFGYSGKVCPPCGVIIRDILTGVLEGLGEE